jgi:signal transduction histidine kinase
MTEPWKSKKVWLAILAVGGFFWLIDVSQSLLLGGTLGRSARSMRLVVSLLTYWMTYAAVVPPVLYLAARIRLDGAFRPWRLAVHVLASVCFVVAHIGLASLAQPPFLSGEVFGRFVRMFYTYSAGNFLVYWLLLGVYYTLYYYQEARTKELQAVHLQAVLTESKLQALRSQLNPHFLFNTLNTIFVLAKKGDQASLLRTIARLSELLRVTTDEARPAEISLSDELSFLRTYLEIQSTRFSDRLRVEYDIAPEACNALVPTMILQPLAENAIKYGLSEQVGHAVISVRAFCKHDSLILEVADDGPGFASQPGHSRPMGIGLANTEARLRYLYGAQQSIHYSRPDVPGAVVTISLPFRKAPEPQLAARAG